MANARWIWIAAWIARFYRSSAGATWVSRRLAARLAAARADDEPAATGQREPVDPVVPVVEMAALVSFDFHYLYVSAASRDLFGRTPRELIGRDVFEFVHPDDRLLVEGFITSEDLMWAGRSGVVYRVMRPGGGFAWCETIARALGEKDARYVGEHVLVHRLLKKPAQTKRSFRRAPLNVGAPLNILSHPVLFQQANWRAFDRLLDRDWARALLDGSPMSMLFVDVDHFALLLSHDRPISTGLDADKAEDADEVQRHALSRAGDHVGLPYPALRALARRPLTSDRPTEP